MQKGGTMQYPEFYTEEMIQISNINKEKTRKLLNVPKGYQMHHKDMNLRWNDPERYILWLPEDIIVLSPSEHARIHNNNRSEELLKKMGASQKKRFSDPKVREAFSNYSKDLWQNEEYRAKTCIPVRCISTGIEYASAKEASIKTGVCRSTICLHCKGKRKNSDWEYIDPTRQRLFERSI